ncbi:hypothetical protein NX059_001613 [Plenodomus lindquistii]|nr:hypothetical protein NX059_001613 [Plenodomus lindquistii]
MPLELLAFISLATILWYTINTRLVATPIPGIPYNHISKYLPWGDLLTLGWYKFTTGEVFSYFSLQCLKKKSPMVQLFIPSFSTTRPTLVLADIYEIEDVVTKRMVEIDRADVMHTWFGTVAPTASIGLKSSDQTFREQRRLWSVVLSPRFLENIAAESFWESAVKLTQLWERQTETIWQQYSKNLPYDVVSDIKLTTLDAMWKMNVGSELGALDARISRLHAPKALQKPWNGTAAFAPAEMPEFFNVFGTLLICLDWIMQGISPQIYTLFLTITGILARANERKTELGRTIETSRQHIRYGKDCNDTCALDQVVRKHSYSDYKTETPNNKAIDTALIDELFELLITGHDTTASTIAWALKYLTDNPKPQSQLRHTLYATFPSTSQLPSAKDIFTASVPYLDAVIAETLRISNTGPVSFRQTQIRCEILGHTIPAGTPFLLVTAGPSYMSPEMPAIPECVRSRSCLAALHRTDQKAPSKSSKHSLAIFEPARWLEKDGAFDPSAVKMLPFSAGSRGCFGRRIALLELKIMLTILSMRFEFPKLKENLSGYAARDGLTRRPASC